MIDFARIKVKSGDGGRGAGSFHALKGRPYGKANGGDGGDGGNVVVEATADLNTLEKYRFMKSFKAEKGGDGFSNFRKGARGIELILRVPVGTQVNTGQVVVDLAELGARVLVARGGMGGRGNAHLHDEFGRRPKTGEVGQIGESVELTLELKLIADVGLIGLPNAGKSTLISKLTHATPKIAAYPFTTLEANLGVLDNSGKNLVIADIPGLIAGASEGRGLGHLFLKHIERTKILVHLVDASSPESLWDQYQTVRFELKNHSAELMKKKEIIVLSKADLATKEQLEKGVLQFKSKRKKVLVISAETGQGLEELVASIFASKS